MDFYLCKSNTTLGVERPTRPAKYVKGAMPEAVVAKGDQKVDAESEQKVSTAQPTSSAKPVENPIQVVKCSSSLDVVGCKKIDNESYGEPDDVWAEEEESASDKGSHPTRPGTARKVHILLHLNLICLHDSESFSLQCDFYGFMPH